MLTPLLGSLLQLAACAVLVLLSGVRLARYGDILATKTGLGGTWVGLVLLATVTSLPELITGASAVLLFKVPEIAVGDVLGSCMFNLVILACLDFGRQVPLSASIHQGHVLAAGFGLLQLGLAALAVLAGPLAPTAGWVGVHSLVFLGVYALATRTIANFERTRLTALAEELTGDIRYRDVSLQRVLVLYALAATVLIGAAAYLPGAGASVARETGLDQSFVGSLFIAASTSLPEVVVSAAAVRIGALDMAASNLFGSNLFNVAVLGFDDVLFTSGSLLGAVSASHALTAVAAMTMTAIAIIGLTYRAQRKRYRLSWDALAIIGVYLLTAALLWRQA